MPTFVHLAATAQVLMILGFYPTWRTVTQPQMGKQRRLVGHQLIEAAIQRVLGNQSMILA
jgi:hypothetical protein